MAAPSALTPELRIQVERDLATGATQAVVAQRAGVTSRTLRKWLATGKVTPQVEAQPATSEPLAIRLERAEPGLVASVIAAAQRGHWQAAAWLLERSFPERWGRREPQTPPVPQDRFSEVDELATRRRAA